MKRQGKALTILIDLSTTMPNKERDFVSEQRTLKLSDLPELHREVIEDAAVDMFETITVDSSIENAFGESTVITAACVDGRTIDLKLIPAGSLPPNHSAIFLFSSALFDGAADSSRQKLMLDEKVNMKSLRRALRKHVASTISLKIPEVGEKNSQTRSDFEQRFPHLLGYFEQETVGLVQRDEALGMAQQKFFMDQRAVLEADDLDQVTFEKSLDVSSRTLTEYILYRNLIIQKLREIGDGDDEKSIHSLIAPRYKTFKGTEFMNDVYSNNAWVLDDKFMTFSTILSEGRMDELIGQILLSGEPEKDGGRPDISMIFSSDPNVTSKVDVVVVELKKRTDDEEKNAYAVNQLLQRAEKLVASCPNIQRMWYYGVVQINESMGRRLRQMNYSPLFSKGHVYYQEFKTEAPDGSVIPTPTFVMSFDAVIDDAEARNSTFLRLLREDIKERSQPATASETPPEQGAEPATGSSC